MRLFDAERKVMELIWAQPGITAKEIAAALAVSTDWSKTTTYTMITRCMDKGYLRREDPKFHCYPLISREAVSIWETDELLSNNFAGSTDLLLTALVGQKRLSAKKLRELAELVEQMEEQEK